ncbi:CinA family nicotinamide mononucleotide deamidase-related protein [Pseudohalioglobus sediminis]|uniref:CinA-like protein n=1 Tax=Pseudohalioglobus sediminis TaxID=2606449 RepID=A0A5B0WPX3_9GAMM|nr:CinA family nicotinamide mononucleotide deamidase-related protein [Pseudohalioglobus sediminis]KAA1188993.1 CinA family nicotinamide mononucleotide deamidase-related protein [Pseudohalioglobus sediminis]
MTNHTPRVQLLLTGNEIMSGDTVDSNSALIAKRLDELAISVYRKVTVGDDPALLKSELASMAQAADVVIINGGLGPTVDDLTAEILAAVAGVELAEHPEALAHLESWCAGRNLPLNAANRKQALLPAGCHVIDNPIGSAVGFEMTVSDCRIICTPGVPGELRAMLDWIISDLARGLQRPVERDILRLQTFGLGESSAQQLISDQIPDWPQEVELGFRAGAPQMEIKLSIDRNEDQPARAHCLAQLEALFGDHIIGQGDTLLAGRVLSLLRERKATLATAESCTGGLIASMLTQIPGSSDAFHAGFVTYANDIKRDVLGVSQADLDTHGAVSEEVVRAMALGAMDRARANYAVAVSGIAGPGGGSDDKPVGTVWLAWGEREHLRTRCLCWPVERSLFQTMIAAAALDMIRRMLLGIDEEPRYFRQRRAR